MLKVSIYEGGSNASSCVAWTHPRPAVHADGARPARAFRGGAPVWRQADAVARVERAGRTRDRASLRAGEGRGAVDRMAVLRPLCEGDQRPEEGTWRRH